MQDDQLDVLLLRDRPYDLLLKYQPLFELIARKYARAGYFPFEDCREMVQIINERFCLHIGKITRQFSGNVLVKTYLSAICRNVIKEYIRSLHRRDELMRCHMVCEPEYQVPVYARLVMLDEFSRFDKILILMGHKRHKLLLLMKLLYRIRLERTDLEAYRKDAMDYISEQILNQLNTDTRLKDKDVYSLIFPLFAIGEGKVSHPDTLRKWFNYKSAEVIRLLNGNPPRAAYCCDTLQILVERYFTEVYAGNYVPDFKGVDSIWENRRDWIHDGIR
ncbi:MAG TPA: hypothetical protein P5228_08200 [Bacteroidales bacterium]|nr:hypothetical protein [Bacteroidales bacterium]HRZ49835.1 hypothetical protein [Bacteroidales bacterium]